jgi:hypothetical protein
MSKKKKISYHGQAYVHKHASVWYSYTDRRPAAYLSDTQTLATFPENYPVLNGVREESI